MSIAVCAAVGVIGALSGSIQGPAAVAQQEHTSWGERLERLGRVLLAIVCSGVSLVTTHRGMEWGITKLPESKNLGCSQLITALFLGVIMLMLYWLAVLWPWWVFF